MSSKEIEAELAELGKEAAPLLVQLDIYVEEFAAAVPGPAADWIQRETERQIESNADRLASLGKPRLSTLKGELAILIAHIPELARSTVADLESRPHHCPTVHAGAPSRTSDYFSSAYRTVVSQVGALLARASLLPERGRDHTWESSGAGSYRYQISTGFESLQIPSVIAYESLYGQFHELAVQMERKRKALIQARARELWESV